MVFIETDILDYPKARRIETEIIRVKDSTDEFERRLAAALERAKGKAKDGVVEVQYSYSATPFYARFLTEHWYTALLIWEEQ